MSFIIVIINFIIHYKAMMNFVILYKVKLKFNIQVYFKIRKKRKQKVILLYTIKNIYTMK